LGALATRAGRDDRFATARDGEAILEGLTDGTIEILCSDHAPHCDYEKEVEFDYAPFGIIGFGVTEGKSESIKRGMANCEHFLRPNHRFDWDAPSLVYQEKRIAFAQKFPFAAIRPRVDTRILTGIFDERWWRRFWRFRQRLATSLRTHQLNRILNNGVGTVALHGVDGCERAYTFFDVDLQRRRKGDHASGMSKDRVTIQRIDGDPVTITSSRSKLFRLDV